MGNSGNILIQKVGINFLWYSFFVSSHYFYYYKDLTNSFLFINNYLLNYFRSHFFLLYKFGLLFSHLKIFYNKKFYNINLFFFDLFYNRIKKFFFYKFSLKFKKKNFYSNRYKNKFLVHYSNKYYLRYQELRNYKRFYSRFFKFKNSLLFGVKTKYLFLNNNFFFNLFKYYFKNNNNFLKLFFLKNDNNLKFSLKINSFFNFFFFSSKFYNLNLKKRNLILFKIFKKNIFKFYKGKEKSLTQLNNFFFNYINYKKLYYTRKRIFVKDKFVNFLSLRFFLRFFLRFRFFNLLFNNNYILNNKFFIFLCFLFYKLIKQKYNLIKIDLNFFIFFKNIRILFLKNFEYFIFFIRLFYNIYYFFFFRRLLKIIFKKFYIKLLNNFCIFFQKKIYTVFNIKSKFNFFNLSKYSLTPNVVISFFKYKMDRRFPYREVLRRFLYSRNKLVIGFYAKAHGRFTKKQRAATYKKIRGKLSFTNYNNILNHVFFTYISKYGTCGIRFWINYNKKFLFNKKIFINKVKLC